VVLYAFHDRSLRRTRWTVQQFRRTQAVDLTGFAVANCGIRSQSDRRQGDAGANRG